MSSVNFKRILLFLSLLALSVILLSGCGRIVTAEPVTPFLLTNNPPDSDKPIPVPAGNNSCWMHTAANMLASAGYGTGNTHTDRADEIFAEMATWWTVNDHWNGGWTDNALTTWLNSPFNTWTNNPYTLVTVYGFTDCTPYNEVNGTPLFIANQLRDDIPAGIAIRWPRNEPPGGWPCQGGHAITAVGDDNVSLEPLTNNPGQTSVTDSDRDDGGDIQSYSYDGFTNPNPGGPNEGNGWYFSNYSGANFHPYIIQVVTLSRTTTGAGANSVRVLGSYRIEQNCEDDAIGLIYEVGTDVDILLYQTWLDTLGTSTITETQPNRELSVEWDLSEEPVPENELVTITTEFVEPNWNAIYYNNVHFKYPPLKTRCRLDYANIHWVMETPLLEDIEKNYSFTGGYVVGAFEIRSDDDPDQPITQYRFQHQYLPTQDPEFHTVLIGGNPGFSIHNLRFGHSYGYLSENDLWEFKTWFSREEEIYRLGDDEVKIIIDWEGKLPYPEGLK